MAYNAVPTVSNGDTWTAANWNTYVRDNFAAGIPDIFTARGDIALATGANAAARLAIGRDNQVLVPDTVSTGARWGGSGHFARYKSTSSISCASGSVTRLQFDTKDYDLSNAVTTGASWAYVTPALGVYMVCCSLEIYTATAGTAGAAGTEYSVIMYSGTAATAYITRKYVQVNTKPTQYLPLFGTCVTYAAAGTSLSVRLYQNSGSAQFDSGTANADNNWVSICRIL